MSDEAASAAETKAPKRGVGTVAREAIRAGKTNEEALAAVQAEFPDANSSLATISWYRNDLRKKEQGIPSGREVKKAAAAAGEQSTKDPLEG